VGFNDVDWASWDVSLRGRTVTVPLRAERSLVGPWSVRSGSVGIVVIPAIVVEVSGVFPDIHYERARRQEPIEASFRWRVTGFAADRAISMTILLRINLV
jgi:hypothetical protein